MPTVNQLADQLLDIMHDENPVAASQFGIPGYDDRLPDLRAETAADYRSRAEQVAGQVGSADSETEQDTLPPGEAPDGPTAYYLRPALDGSRPGTYFANTYLVEERERFTAEGIAFHEAVPGHHFQLALAQELTELPMLRRLARVTVYLEGWGLYTERLADEMGLYSDDLARLGMLAADSIRAARLVVDTGLHAMGWSRQQVVEYLRANTVMDEVDIQSETDRYIEWPGQALSYMVGRLEIQRLREHAEQELGAAFDIRAFHDTVLCNGILPLSVLSDVVGDWVAAARR